MPLGPKPGVLTQQLGHSTLPLAADYPLSALRNRNPVCPTTPAIAAETHISSRWTGPRAGERLPTLVCPFLPGPLTCADRLWTRTMVGVHFIFSMSLSDISLPISNVTRMSTGPVDVQQGTQNKQKKPLESLEREVSNRPT